ncbi:glycosyltransferase involved in cell wall biosynthesis [Kitasatospora sp. GAS204A]|uniref:glycosyltransferase n=1 Tax=unclassified Kitasatospora TaxID=2633591 RepID=UPI0024750953|nr:glycosyltransferase [Kitasatospora sp. GAS204B]MDH6119371.1 glycosyltransferase involved in cell wall biosynthesis [Kitasatospora sp. GAS204B]
MSTRTEPLVLIEPYAHLGGGHHQRTLTALAAARPGALVITPQGIADGPGPLLRAGSCIAAGPVGPAAKVLLAGARAAARVSTAGKRLFRSRRWPVRLRRLPHQVTLVARCLTEAACLRTARHLAPQPAAVVILSASEALHGAAALLGGGQHLRFVHELVASEDRPLRWLGRLARRSEKHVVALYPTSAVRDQLQRGFPRLPGRVRAFAVDDGRCLTEAEREGARSAFTIPTGARAVCLVGGWWPYKDIATVDAALARLTKPLHLLVCGTPLDDAVLERWHRLPLVRVHTVPGPVGEDVLRLVYAAADAALVARRPGIGKESGLVMDAARLGVPLVVSDHDPDLTERLAGQPWARLFPAGDPDSLAAALDRLAAGLPERPGPQAPAVLDMLPATEQAAYLTDTYTDLAKECR